MRRRNLGFVLTIVATGSVGALGKVGHDYVEESGGIRFAGASGKTVKTI